MQLLVSQWNLCRHTERTAGFHDGNFQQRASIERRRHFDGLSAVTITLSQDTIQAVATAVTWSGTYSVQSDCVAALNITTQPAAQRSM